MDEDVKLSKTLSYFLRHRPDAAGLTLDSQGWANTDAVLAALSEQGVVADLKRLLQVVDNSDKNRFELSADNRRIRARQGHSVKVEGDWIHAVSPEILYHGTVERFLPAILAEGLKPMQRHHVHLSGDRATAEKVGARRGEAVVLIVEAKRLAGRGQQFWLTGNGVWLTDHVPPSALRRG